MAERWVVRLLPHVCVIVFLGGEIFLLTIEVLPQMRVRVTIVRGVGVNNDVFRTLIDLHSSFLRRCLVELDKVLIAADLGCRLHFDSLTFCKPLLKNIEGCSSLVEYHRRQPCLLLLNEVVVDFQASLSDWWDRRPLPLILLPRPRQRISYADLV